MSMEIVERGFYGKGGFLCPSPSFSRGGGGGREKSYLVPRRNPRPSKVVKLFRKLNDTDYTLGTDDSNKRYNITFDVYVALLNVSSIRRNFIEKAFTTLWAIHL